MVKRARCEPQDESDDNTADDEQEAPESLSLVLRNADTIDSNTDSDDSDHDADDTWLCLRYISNDYCIIA